MYRIFILCIILIACGAPNREKPNQLQKVAQAEKMLKEERVRLKTMRDSLPIKIKQNVEQLHITAEQAEELERPLIKIQETIITSAERNLQVQRSLLDSLQKYGP